MLTPKQEAFAIAYASGTMTASDAYRRAYPTSTKWAYKTVNEAASRLLAHSKVLARVEELRDRARAVLDVTPERTIRELAKGAYGEVSETLSWQAKTKCLELLGRVDGIFERDNTQKQENLAIQINLVGPAEKAEGDLELDARLVDGRGE
jgi:hypothetical protein